MSDHPVGLAVGKNKEKVVEIHVSTPGPVQQHVQKWTENNGK